MACAQKVFACGIDGQVGHCITPRHRWRQKMRTKFNMKDYELHRTSIGDLLDVDFVLKVLSYEMF